MPLIQWNDSFSVKVAEIDGQHQRLIQMANTLDEAMRQGKGKDVIGKTIGDMIRYTQSHFATEEKYFDQFGYPDAADHKAEHAAFVDKVVAFRDSYGAGQLGLTIQVMTFLSDWLKTHIQGSDKKYGPFLNAKGLS